MIRNIPFKFGFGNTVYIYGGPYRARPTNTYNICMAAEIDEPADIRVETRDFSVPDTEELLAALKGGLLALGARRQVFVGCMGGIGRTGLYLAAMAKVLGEKYPVIYVRENYLSHAVETKEQMRFINELDVSSLKLTALAAKVGHALLFWK